MKQLIKPQKLSPGDRIATVSLSWGGAGDDEIKWRYSQGKERIKKLFDLDVVEMPHTLSAYKSIFGSLRRSCCPRSLSCIIASIRLGSVRVGLRLQKIKKIA